MASALLLSAITLPIALLLFSISAIFSLFNLEPKVPLTKPLTIPVAAVTPAPNIGFMVLIAPPKVLPTLLIAFPAPDSKPLLNSLLAPLPIIFPAAVAKPLLSILPTLAPLKVFFRLRPSPFSPLRVFRKSPPQL